MSQSITKVLSKILTVIFVLSLFATSLPINAAESKNSIDDLKKIQNNIREKDPYKVQSSKLIRKNKDVQVSNQLNLDIEIDSAAKQIRVKNKNKGNTAIGIPNGDQLTDVQTIENQVIFSNKNLKFDVVVEAIDGGMRQVINLKDSSAPTVYDFPISLETGEKLVVNENGSAIIIKPISQEEKAKRIELAKTAPAGVKIPDYDTKALIAKPWAKDANGKELKTFYSIVGSNLRQTIDTKDAIFPVVADPQWCGSQISSTYWYQNPDASHWTLSVYPSWCGIYYATAGWGIAYNDAWNDVCSASGTYGWCSYWNNNQYASMFYQFVCHYNIIGYAKSLVPGSTQYAWNLDEWRPNVGWVNTLAAICNPN